jgi:hypothetical protein
LDIFYTNTEGEAVSATDQHREARLPLDHRRGRGRPNRGRRFLPARPRGHGGAAQLGGANVVGA